MDDLLYIGMTHQFQALSEHAGLELAYFGDMEGAVEYIKEIDRERGRHHSPVKDNQTPRLGVVL